MRVRSRPVDRDDMAGLPDGVVEPGGCELELLDSAERWPLGLCSVDTSLLGDRGELPPPVGEDRATGMLAGRVVVPLPDAGLAGVDVEPLAPSPREGLMQLNGLSRERMAEVLWVWGTGRGLHLV